MHNMRGSQLYNSLLFQEAPVLTVVKPERKGRSEHLINRRNELIAARYWFYVKIQRKNYMDCLEALEQEMFLSQLTLTRIVTSMTDQLKTYQKQPPEVKVFAKEYPFLVWEA
jgi:hypothetical protein